MFELVGQVGHADLDPGAGGADGADEQPHAVFLTREHKARTRYEFGVKTSIAVTNARAKGGQFILGMHALPGNPFDGHTLSGQIAQVERITGIKVTRAYVDRGYKGHGHKGEAKVYISHTRGITSPTIKRELRRRNAIERDCQDFRVWVGIMGKKESHYVTTQGAGDLG